MKKLFKPTLIALSLAFTTPNIALASGIPTVDAAGIATTIAENLKTLEQLKSQLDAINQQIDQARQFANDTKNRFEGNWNLGDLISNDDFLRSLPKEAKDVLIGNSNSFNLDSLRSKYGLSSENAQTQKSYDALMKYAERTKDVYQNTLKRIKNLTQLKDLANAAQIPAQKQDVANKLALEQLSFNQEQQALKQMEESINIQKKLEIDKVKVEAARSLKQAREDYKKRNSIQ
ncbi:TPA: type IV secretion system protein [Haemophilus influenzae]|uniref:type IV secretion system protein n=1 Tax=Haemophilus influenzae TaxID=727 RepID=UPI000D01B7A0|nr:type IV secretion system protein [Haemophilus influenzae]PRJ70759.1 type IV secretion system protein [Haemophilus influenzae]